MFGLSELTTKLIIGGVLLATLTAAFFSYRHSLIEQGRQEMVAEYEPKVTKLKEQVQDWKASHEQWEASYARLVEVVKTQRKEIDDIHTASEERLANLRKEAARIKKENVALRGTAESQAGVIAELQLPKEKCDAYQSLVDAARRGNTGRGL